MAGLNKASSSKSNDGLRSNKIAETVVVDCGRRKTSCGYCRSPGRSSVTHGLWAHSITVDDYQDLIDRGWRRSGCFLYKPEMDKTCCPSYTIRLKANDFSASKDQIRTRRRMQRFLDGEMDVVKMLEGARDVEVSDVNCHCSCHQVSKSETSSGVSGENEDAAEEKFTAYISDQIDMAVLANIKSGKLPNMIQLPNASVKRVVTSKRKLMVEGDEDLLYTSNVAFRLAAAMRASQSKSEVRQTFGGTPNDVAEWLVESLSTAARDNGLSIRACNGHLNFYSHVNRSRVIQKADKGCKRKGCCLSKTNETKIVKNRKLEVLLKKSCFDPEEYALYSRYQMKVHNESPDHVSEDSYNRFLVDTPLIYVPPSGDGKVPPCGFGSFHQQYVIDGQLVAVGVIDILPNCLSSKYLFWDPDFAFLALGKYSALQEIDWVKENQSACPSLEYYYLGYYIHSCNKMRYKASYRPSELLCPLRYEWVSFDAVRPSLDAKQFVVLSDAARTQEGDAPAPAPPISESALTSLEHQNDSFMDDADFVADPEYQSSDDESGSESDDPQSGGENDDLGDVMLGFKGSRMRYKDLQRAFVLSEKSYLEPQLRKYKKAVGNDLSRRIVFSLG